MPKLPKKLIEVALPLDDINKAAAREKSIRHGHPSTLHLWWARRPLAAARAVLFAQLVNDPGSTYEGDKRTREVKEAIHKERERLFAIIRDLVIWENSTDEVVLEKARTEIRKSWEYTCKITGDDPERMPAVLDPFCGGGTIPLEAQRLGLEARGSDLNPVPALISKALVEIPASFRSMPPIGPTPDDGPSVVERDWPGAEGLAEDIRRYGRLMREEAEKALGIFYPPVKLPDNMGGGTATVIAWIWARTVVSPNPAFAGKHVPLCSTFVLSNMKNKECFIEPRLDPALPEGYRFVVHHRKPDDLKAAKMGTKLGRGGNFRCILSDTIIPSKYIKEQGKAGKMGKTLMAVVAEGNRQRIYLAPEQIEPPQLPAVSPPTSLNADLPHEPRAIWCPGYGLSKHSDLYTERQICFLSTLSSILSKLAQRIESECPADRDASAYSKSVCTYLGLLISGLADRHSTICTWDAGGATWGTKVRNTFSRQGIPMTWDFAEVNPFSTQSGSFQNALEYLAKAVGALRPSGLMPARIELKSANCLDLSREVVISSDPPYYDNIGYADLSDYFYVWLRHSLKTILPELFSTMTTPKVEELISAPYRNGGKEEAHKFFMDGMKDAMARMSHASVSHCPATIYYAFKQSDTKVEGTISTGWESFLSAMLLAGHQITATWPMRTELSNRMIGSGSNALASSIVLACRPRPKNADEITRRQFQRELSKQLPDDLEEMIHGTEGVSPIAPVDLAQAAIGPGMAIFSQYKAVLESDGSPMSVHNALIMINKAIDEYFDAAEGSMDGLTRFCAQWVQQYGFKTGPYGEADGISRACGVSADGHPEAIESGKGKVRLRPAMEYDREISPEMGKTSIWICLHSIAARLEQDGMASAGAYLAANPGSGADIRNLAYRLYTICERAKLADHARTYNNVVTSWEAICEASRQAGQAGEQKTLFES